MIAAQAALETKMLLRNGEQLLLTVVIPTLLLVLFSSVDIVDTGAGEAVDFLTPGILALAVMSTAFTGQAIATGFERRYGVLKRLASSPLPRWGLMTAKTLSVLVTEILQVILLTVIAFALGWSPARQPLRRPAAPGPRHGGLLGPRPADGGHAEGRGDAGRRQPGLPAAAGRRRGHRAAGQVPARGAQDVLGLLPISALSDGLRDVLQHGAGMPWGDLGILAVWAVVGLARGGAVLPLGVGAGRPGPRALVKRVHKRSPYDGRRAKRDPRRRRSGRAQPARLHRRRWTPAPRTVRRAALAALVMAVVIVVTGGAVRLTGSGLGCPTWPKCTDDSLTATSAMGFHGAIEFGNRMLTYVLCAAVGWAIIAARSQKPYRRGLTRLGWAQFWIVMSNAVLGGIVVLVGPQPVHGRGALRADVRADRGRHGDVAAHPRGRRGAPPAGRQGRCSSWCGSWSRPPCC